MPARGSWSCCSIVAGSSKVSDGKDSGEGGGRREEVEPLMLGGVDIGLEGGEVERRMFVRREAKKAVVERRLVSLWYSLCIDVLDIRWVAVIDRLRWTPECLSDRYIAN